MMAVLQGEPGSDKLTVEMLDNAIGSSVNVVEVQTKLVSRGENPDEAWEDALSAIDEVAPFTAEQARIAGSLVTQTRSLGLSLGDRACLALGVVLKAPIYTTDKSWKGLNLGIHIHVIR
jgi:PIN domain nuclease of toxin-antitoxin system